MFKTFSQSFRLRNTYKVNTILYSIKQLPLIKKLLPDSLYQNRGLKIFGNIVSAIWEIISIFIGKLIYLAAMIVGFSTMYQVNSADVFVHLLFFLTIIGALLNTYMFNPTKDKFYALRMMRMNAKEYTLCDYGYAILKVIIGFLPFIFLFGLSAGVSWYICLVIPFFIASLKMGVATFWLWRYQKTGNMTDENHPMKAIWVVTFLLLALAYGLPFIGIVMNQTMFLGLAIISLAIGAFSTWYILHFSHYREVYQQILTETNMKVANYETKDIVKENTLKQIEVTSELKSHKKGYAYFNDLFIKRHRKILSKSAKKTAAILLVCIIAVLVLSRGNDEVKNQINGLMMTWLPYFVFIMYMINRGQVITQAMFMNCDHSMLTYSFYRTPQAILKLFRERLKSVILINLLPASVLAVGLPTILYFTGGTENSLTYFILFISIIAMSIFFSVHHLVLYYLLQPYNAESETKSSTYMIANWITYFICFYLMQVKLPTFYFGIATIAFSVLYSIISLVIVYRLAPRTFKLRV